MNRPRRHVATLLAKAITVTLGSSALAADIAPAPRLALNYERLSSLEEPIAFELGDVTFLATGVLDLPYTLELDGHSPYAGSGSLAQIEIGAKTQLPNRWRVGVTWLAQHAEDAPAAEQPQEDYADHVAVSVGGSWGLVHFGNVSPVVQRQTRRLYGAGHGRLGLDDTFGKLDDWGAAYQVRLGPWLVGAATDQSSNLDIGATFQRPSGVRDYRVTARFSESVCHAPQGVLLDSRAFSSVGEFIYGSTLVDFGIGVEQLSAAVIEADRFYVSSGVRHKTGALTWSIEGHLGRIEGSAEKSVAVGLQYDIARGLSANLGINYAESSAMVGGLPLVDIDATRGVVSLRYGF